jgi:hypothetical protein
MNILPKQQVAYLSNRCNRIIESILKQEGYEATVSKEILTAVTRFFLRDIYRIDEQQRGRISLSKFAGYWGFWIRKLKPISLAKDTKDPTKKELQEINELVAISFSCEIVNLLRDTAAFEDFVWQDCSGDDDINCDGSKCFNSYVNQFMAANRNFFLRYVHYSMRHRTFGPHHFVLFLEQLMFSACVRCQFSLDERKKYDPE